ncbi:MAG: porin family protein [Ginsengibacter sp.]
MKKLFAFAFFTGIYITASSQVYIQGGVNLANISKTESGTTEKNNMLTTFNAGLLGRFNLSTAFDLETGVLVDGRGAKAETYFTNSTDDNYVKAKFNPLYIEVPFNLILRVPLDNKMNIFFNAGPYAAMGIAGKSKLETKVFGASSHSESNIKFSNDDPFTSEQDDAAYDKIKRFDFGLNIGGGLDLGKILLKANYGMGFSKINSTESNNGKDNKNKYRTVSISLGIPLSRK